MARKRRKRVNKNCPAKGRLREMADRLWAIAVKSDWGGKCAVCGSRSTLNSHHLIPRQHETTRYNLRNGICLCGPCHQFDADISPHQSAMGWLIWLENNHPQLVRWMDDTVANGAHRQFDGTKNAAHYCDVIRSLRQYVEPDEFERIVGIKFSRWLENNE